MAERLFPVRRLPASGEVDLRAPIGAFGRYDLLERIDEDEVSETFVARSDGFEGLFRQTALKRMKASQCADTLTVSRFIEEARLAVRIEHHGTVAVDDFGRVGGVYYIAYELLDAVTAERLLQRGRLVPGGAPVLPVELLAAAQIVRAAARAAAVIHATKGADGGLLGVVHGAIQPKNVVVCRDGRVKLTGFVPAALRANVTTLQGVVGLRGLAYQAPEVIDGSAAVDEHGGRTDVWSLGILLYELVSARLPFGQTALAKGDRAGLLRAVLDGRPATLPPETRALMAPFAAMLEDTFAPHPVRIDAATLADRLDDLLKRLGANDNALVEFLARCDDPASAAAAGPFPYDASRGAADDDPATVELERTSPLPSSASDLTVPPQAADPFARTLIAREAHVHAAPRGDSKLTDQLRKDPGLWGLVRHAERELQAKAPHNAAVAMCRTAAILFANRGLLAHALCAYDGARAHVTEADLLLDFERLAELQKGDAALRDRELARVDGAAFHAILRAQTDGGIDRGTPSVTPLLSALSPRAFARLGAVSPVRRVRAGSYLLKEGEAGDSLFAVGDGRLVVTCAPARFERTEPVSKPAFSPSSEPTDPTGQPVRTPESRGRSALVAPDALGVGSIVDERLSRVFLSAFSGGELFGEFSFLTGRPRSASVEAVTACRVVEIQREALTGLLDQSPSLKEALEAFYKERVLEWMLAKNEVFSLLEPELRRALLARCTVHAIAARKVVVREGELHDAMYFIKRGEVEVSIEDAGHSVFVNKLGAGEFFGEIAALEGGPRRASVRAVTDLDVFRVTRADLSAVLKDAPLVRERLSRAMRARSIELRQRILEQREVLAST